MSIRIENVEVFGWTAAIRGLRNPMNSWAKSDSYWTHIENPQSMNTAPFAFFLGENDLALMQRLCQAGSDDRKFMRYINVTMDITAPLYWWKEFDTYKVGTVANSCSTMHKIHAKEFTLDDFSHERMTEEAVYCLKDTIHMLNMARDAYHLTGKKEKQFWEDMIQLLPTSYNQLRTIQLNYEVLLRQYKARKNHKLQEWRDYCAWIETLPYFLDITTPKEVHHE